MAYTRKTWTETLADLDETFDKWGVTNWSTSPQRPPRTKYQSQTERTVIVRWTLRGEELSISLSEHATATENLRAIYNSLDALRLIESRGVSVIVRDVLAKLPPPAGHLVPSSPPAAISTAASESYRILQVQPGAPLDICNAAYRALAKAAAGDEAQLRALNAAIAQIRGQHAAPKHDGGTER
jgi:hypothetical protein